MPLLTVLIVLIVVGVLLWLVNSYIPMDRKIKNILNIVVVIIVVIWLLKAFGLLDSLKSMRIWKVVALRPAFHVISASAVKQTIDVWVVKWIINKFKILVVYLKNVLSDAGNVAIFTTRFFKEIFRPPFEIKEFFRQCYSIGYKSLPLVGITGFIMGLVLTIQSRPTLAEFGAESWLPGMVALSLIKEITPVITALICAGKIASGIGAELGSMKVSEQIDAMEVSAINPYKFLVVTRILAATLMVPLLVVFADGIGVLGGYVGVNIHSDVTMFRYFSQVLASLNFIDILPATIKTFFFGFFIGMIGCYKGFTAANGTESVGKAANTAVVAASLTIFIVDMLAVQVTDLFY